MSSSLRCHGLQHVRLPCLSLTPGACSNSCPSSWWCHSTISSSVIPFSSCLQSFPASGSFPKSQFFSSHIPPLDYRHTSSLQYSSVTRSCPTLCDPMNCRMPGFPVHHQLPEFIQTHVHWVGDAIQPYHPLLSPSPPTFNLSQHQCLFQWVSSSHQVSKVSEFQLKHQSFQWIFRTDFL